MYTIKEAAARTGLRIATIRVWERRYGVVEPARTDGGYRLYDDDAIARLRAMRDLVEDGGWRPRQAAEQVLLTPVDALAELAPARTQSVPGDGLPERLPRGPAEETINAFVAAVRDLDVATLERILDEAFAIERFERAMARTVFPAMRAVGEAWAAGEVDVAAEHAASETVRRRLARFFDASGRAGAQPDVLVGAPPDSLHDLGAFAFGVAARRAGLRVLYLGANVPLWSWLQTARKTRARAAVMAVVTTSDVTAASEVITGLRRLETGPTCFIGGAAAGRVSRALAATELPEALDDAVSIVAVSLRAEPGARR